MKNNYGEILATSERGVILSFACSLPEVSSVVEIGTLDGTGSTRLIIEQLSMKAKNGADVRLITVEANRAAYELALVNIGSPNLSVQVLHGSLIHLDSPLLLIGLTPQENLWFQNDVDNRFINTPNILEKIPEQIDLLVLDGGEFTTFNDYLVLRRRCKYLFLDDTSVRKNRLVYRTAVEDGFSLLKGTDEGNGACLLARF